MTNAERAGYGWAAMRVGTPDFQANDAAGDVRTNAVDAVANILHAVRPEDPDSIVESALMHYWAEVEGRD
jgi:hypothetical protein